jgi:hypothetical protein
MTSAVSHIAIFMPHLKIIDGAYHQVYEVGLRVKEDVLADRHWYTVNPDMNWDSAYGA